MRKTIIAIIGTAIVVLILLFNYYTKLYFINQTKVLE